jgi:hypothetical protein
MSNQQIYTLAFVTVNGPLLVQQQHVSVRRKTNSQDVATVALGYAGESPGAPMVTIDVTNAVPTVGFEFNAGGQMLSLTPGQVYIVLGSGKIQLKTTVQIIEDSFEHGVNKQATYSFSARGAFQDWS